MMLDHLGEAAAAQDLLSAVESTLVRPEARTRDLGGSADTRRAGEAILAALTG
jgi:tartrate dehydrogenase/decarboxylase/D-malate dehydrogenase